MIRGAQHFSDPPIVLFDGGGDVTLPAVAGKEDIGDRFTGIAHEASHRLAEQQTIGLSTLSSVFIEGNQVVVGVSFRDGADGHGPHSF